MGIESLSILAENTYHHENPKKDQKYLDVGRPPPPLVLRIFGCQTSYFNAEDIWAPSVLLGPMIFG